MNTMLSKLKRPFVMVLIGPPLSGKDTFLKDMTIDYKMISRDQILLDVAGSDNYNWAYDNVDHKEVDRILREQLTAYGKSDDNCVVNMTNMTSKRRRYNLSFFKNHIKIGIIFPILSDEEYARRNKKRALDENKTIPIEVLKRMLESYQPIAPEEGFDKVISL